MISAGDGVGGKEGGVFSSLPYLSVLPLSLFVFPSCMQVTPPVCRVFPLSPPGANGKSKHLLN